MAECSVGKCHNVAWEENLRCAVHILGNRRKMAVQKIRAITLVREAKSVPCADCGGHYPYYVMEFDHVRGVKKFRISRANTHTHSLGVLRTEIAKCEVVCANCHHIRTWSRMQSDESSA